MTDVINIVRQRSVYVIRDKQAETGGARRYKCYINGEKEHVMRIWYDWLCNHHGFIEFNYKDKANPEKSPAIGMNEEKNVSQLMGLLDRKARWHKFMSFLHIGNNK